MSHVWPHITPAARVCVVPAPPLSQRARSGRGRPPGGLPCRVPHEREAACRHRPHDDRPPEEGPATRHLADEQPDPHRIQHRFDNGNQTMMDT